MLNNTKENEERWRIMENESSKHDGHTLTSCQSQNMPLKNHLQSLWPGLAGAQLQHLGQLVTSLLRPGDVTPVQRTLVSSNLDRRTRRPQVWYVQNCQALLEGISAVTLNSKLPHRVSQQTETEGWSWWSSASCCSPDWWIDHYHMILPLIFGDFSPGLCGTAWVGQGTHPPHSSQQAGLFPQCHTLASNTHCSSQTHWTIKFNQWKANSEVSVMSKFCNVPLL